MQLPEVAVVSGNLRKYMHVLACMYGLVKYVEEVRIEIFFHTNACSNVTKVTSFPACLIVANVSLMLQK